tara:strand:+ start:388 stop:801 length:414 start_codon:yes stop_codon:yes gene_type:complete
VELEVTQDLEVHQEQVAVVVEPLWSLYMEIKLRLPVVAVAEAAQVLPLMEQQVLIQTVPQQTLQAHWEKTERITQATVEEPEQVVVVQMVVSPVTVDLEITEVQEVFRDPTLLMEAQRTTAQVFHQEAQEIHTTRQV